MALRLALQGRQPRLRHLQQQNPPTWLTRGASFGVKMLSGAKDAPFVTRTSHLPPLSFDSTGHDDEGKDLLVWRNRSPGTLISPHWRSSRGERHHVGLENAQKS